MEKGSSYEWGTESRRVISPPLKSSKVDTVLDFVSRRSWCGSRLRDVPL